MNRPLDLEWNVKPWSRHNFDARTVAGDGVPPTPPPHIAMAKNMMTTSSRKFSDAMCKPWSKENLRSPEKAGFDAATQNFKPWSRHLGGEASPKQPRAENVLNTNRSNVSSNKSEKQPWQAEPRLQKTANVTAKVTHDWTELSAPSDRPGNINVGGSLLSRVREVRDPQKSTLGSFTTPIIVYRPEEEMSNEQRAMRQRLRRIADANMADKALFSSFSKRR